MLFTGNIKWIFNDPEAVLQLSHQLQRSYMKYLIPLSWNIWINFQEFLW